MLWDLSGLNIANKSWKIAKTKCRIPFCGFKIKNCRKVERVASILVSSLSGRPPEEYFICRPYLKNVLNNPEPVIDLPVDGLTDGKEMNNTIQSHFTLPHLYLYTNS